MHGAGAAQEDRRQHLQQTGSRKSHSESQKWEEEEEDAEGGGLRSVAMQRVAVGKTVAVMCVLQSFTQSLKRRMSLKNTLYSCGVTYEIVSNIPKVLKCICDHWCTG